MSRWLFSLIELLSWDWHSGKEERYRNTGATGSPGLPGVPQIFRKELSLLSLSLNPAVSDKSLVALRTDVSRGHTALSVQSPGPPQGTRKRVLAAAATAPACSGVEFGGYNFYSQRKPW